MGFPDNMEQGCCLVALLLSSGRVWYHTRGFNDSVKFEPPCQQKLCELGKKRFTQEVWLANAPLGPSRTVQSPESSAWGRPHELWQYCNWTSANGIGWVSSCSHLSARPSCMDRCQCFNSNPKNMHRNYRSNPVWLPKWVLIHQDTIYPLLCAYCRRPLCQSLDWMSPQACQRYWLSQLKSSFLCGGLGTGLTRSRNFDRWTVLANRPLSLLWLV